MPASAWTAQKQRAAPADPSATELAGQLAQVRQQFDNADGSVTVIADLLGGESVKGTAESRGELKPGGDYRFLGRWLEHEKYGWQFAFDAALAEAPDDPDGAAAYLSRHADRVGLVTAARLVAAYGRDAPTVLIDDTARVVADGLMSADDAALASESLRRVYADPALREAHRDLFGLLRGHGFYGKAIRAALRRWRASAPAQVRRDPFLMMTAGLPGCGFLRCDRLYLAMGRPPGRLKRQALAAWYALSQLDGDTWASAAEALSAVRRQVGGTRPRERRAVAMLCRAGMAQCRTDAAGRVWVAESHKARSERACAHYLRQLAQMPARWPAVETLGLDPATDAHQIDQLRAGLSGAVCLLTGGPGTGKTFCAATVVRGLVKMVGAAKIAVCAPTGKAAVRITEKLAEARLPLKATTIHSLLRVRPVESADGGWGFEHDERKPLPFSHVIVDELSMADVSLAAALLRALHPETCLLFSGDPGQLPPVGHGAFLRDLIDSQTIARAHLTEIRRNAGLIVRACHQIKDGKLPKLPTELTAFAKDSTTNLIRLPWGGDRTERQRTLTERLDTLYDWLRTQDRWDIIDAVQVICPRNATRTALNDHLQDRLNAAGEKGPVGKCRVGDKVICLRNGWAMGEGRQQVYVANGDLGRVREFRGRAMVIELAAPRRLVAVPLTKGAAEQVEAQRKDVTGDDAPSAASWDLAYAVTCHKYQGSEVPVVLGIIEGAGKLGSRELLYTMVSRARELCVLIADQPDLRKYTANVTLPDRKTFLSGMLRGEEML